MINNVLVINSSINGDSGIVGKMSESFINGMISQNANVETVHIAGLNINSCRGCTEDLCFESSGQCQIDDDMQLLLPKLINSDIWIIATPVNDNTLDKNLRNFIDRLEPLYEPFFNMLNGTSKKKAGKIVLLACSNKSEIEVFNELADQLKILANMLGREFAGSILRPQIWALSALDNFGKFSLEFLNNIFIAGAELIRDEKLKKTTLTAISSELINKKSFITQIQSYYQQVI